MNKHEEMKKKCQVVTSQSGKSITAPCSKEDNYTWKEFPTPDLLFNMRSFPIIVQWTLFEERSEAGLSSMPQFVRWGLQKIYHMKHL